MMKDYVVFGPSSRPKTLETQPRSGRAQRTRKAVEMPWIRTLSTPAQELGTTLLPNG